ncbi:MAG: branched-chain amino acid ABC transporter permease [Oscillospiraceae bacterium]|jgi:branched-chain amino acid transport system permease protein|nr:branched-chain amino acid ABC transporter permease [Oscillospiraceae bacterium]
MDVFQKHVLRNKYLQYLLVGALFLIPVIFPGFSTSFLTLMGGVVYLAIAGTGYNVLLGYSGQISLGHAAFMGLSAYVSAYLTGEMGLPFGLSFLFAVLAPFLVGLLLGAIAVRLQGFYLAIATLGFGEILRLIFIEMDWFTGGFSGSQAKYPMIFGARLTKEQTYIGMVVLMVLLMMLVYHLVNSHTGRALIAMKNSQHAAQAMGISIFKYKLVAFAISSLFAGISGVCYVHFIRYSDPTVWTAMLSLNLIAQVVVGGNGTIGGPIIGALVIRGLPDLLKSTPIIGEIAGIPVLLSGVLMIVVLMFYSKGLIFIPAGIRLALRKHILRREREKGKGA